MYEVFYNFKAEPFRLSPDHKFCYEHKSYAKARAYMAYAFKRAEGFVMITGRPGTGKTTLIGELVEGLSKDRVCTANLVCTQLQADDLLKSVAFSFGIGSVAIDKAETLQRLTTLLHRWHREGRRALLIVDEAQDLSSSAMEELRLLTNIQIGGQPLLQIFLVGQPELRDLILSPEMEQVHQRIVAASHIEGLGVEETEAYVLHRLTIVGWRGDPAIDRAIFPLIHKFSEGVPRRINLICSRLFLLGSVEQRHDIRVEDVRIVITELQAENLAVGTEASQEDFDQVEAPEWVTVPQSEPQVVAQPRLHAVDNEPMASVDNVPPDSPSGAKKKVPSELTVQEHRVPQKRATLDETGYDQAPESPQYDDSAQAVSDTPAYPVGSGRVAPRSDGHTKSPIRLRRAASLGGLIVGVIVLIFLSMYLSDGDASSRVQLGSAPTASIDRVVDASLELRVVEPQSADRSTEQAASLPSPRNGDKTGTPPSSPLAQVVSEQAQSAQISLPDHDTSHPSDSVNVPDQTEMTSTGDSSAGIVELPVAEHQEPESNSEGIISVNFGFDSDELMPDSHLALEQAVVMLRENPGRIAAITGFTDKHGAEDYNLVLSRKRAEAVKRYLVDAGIAQDRLLVEGRGARAEVAVADHPEAQHAMEPNRVVRIELSGDRAQ